jgi:hypothetical protein
VPLPELFPIEKQFSATFTEVATRYCSCCMHRIIYLSWASTPLTIGQLQELLAASRQRNAALAITGLLLYGNGCFMQVLEGEEAVVRALYEQIKRDTRHRYVTAYADKPIPQRAFAEWAMAFEALTPQQVDGATGYIAPTEVVLDTVRLPLADMHLIDLLRSFTLP